MPNSKIIGFFLLVGLMGFLITKESPYRSLIQFNPPVSGKSVSLEMGAKVPDFGLQNTHGETVTLADLKGNQSILIFVRHSCSFCTKLKKELLKQNISNLGKRLIFITSIVKNDTLLPAEVLEIERQISQSYIVLKDSTNSVAEDFKAMSVPTTYLIDTEGMLIAGARGFPDSFKLVKQFAKKSM